MAEERKHTPGPWTYEFAPYTEAERHGPSAEWSWLFVGPLDEETGRISSTLFEGGVTHGLGDGDPEADARLIAAAPDLLAALEGVLRVADRQTVEFDAARAAIKRATQGPLIGQRRQRD